MKIFSIGFILCICFWSFTWIGIDVPSGLNFDEFHYIPAAKSILETGKMVNTEHPPLAKMIIATGIKILGDNPYGWRIMATIFGSLTLMGIFFWAAHLFSSLWTGIFVSFICISNFMLYVESRIAMLDTFMCAFLVWSAFCYSYWWKHKDKVWILYTSAALVCLGVATKWFSLFPLATMGILLLYCWIKKTVSFKNVLIFSMTGLFSYVAVYIVAMGMDPELGFSLSSFFKAQYTIWESQQRVPGVHPYLSKWWSWPLELRPIWYFYEGIEGSNLVHGIILLGNPLILWGGIMAISYCAYLSIFKKCSIAQEILLAYSVCLLPWAIIPREATFFYYYYPAVLIIAFAWARALRGYKKIQWGFLALSLGLFFYFLPVLNATPVQAVDFNKWMWTTKWI